MRVLDTDTCVEILRGNQAVIAQRAATHDAIATTWITAAELAYGASKSLHPERNQNRVIAFLHSLPVVEMNMLAAERFGAIKTNLERSGQLIADADLWIASISLAHGAVLVTGNRRHYERVAGLMLENWIPR